MRRCRLFAGGLMLMLLAGCAGYGVGPTNGESAGEKTVELKIFANQTLEPRLGDAFATALRREIQRDGTYQLSTHGAADIVVSGVLTRYDRRELSFAPKDVLTVTDYRINVTAKVTARNIDTGKVLLDQQEVTGYTLIRVGSDLTSSERQALPLLADDLAKNVTALLVDGSW
jgi:hypothetical protein